MADGSDSEIPPNLSAINQPLKKVHYMILNHMLLILSRGWEG